MEALSLDAVGGLTVCVTCVCAGVDSAWEQKKCEARKLPAAGRARRPQGRQSHFSGPGVRAGVGCIISMLPAPVVGCRGSGTLCWAANAVGVVHHRTSTP